MIGFICFLTDNDGIFLRCIVILILLTPFLKIREFIPQSFRLFIIVPSVISILHDIDQLIRIIFSICLENIFIGNLT